MTTNLTKLNTARELSNEIDKQNKGKNLLYDRKWNYDVDCKWKFKGDKIYFNYWNYYANNDSDVWVRSGNKKKLKWELVMDGTELVKVWRILSRWD